ncbi:acyl-coenzyme A diphosphatase FITM2 [Osmerus eperlanus]|uniref:acyl-coenzyme A diphosphatase FITM2 n=1 Tax=Osmerus eperlanus TaxID=29151 RepID=UPI002E141F85
MAGTAVLVAKLVGLWKTTFIRNHFHWLFLCISVLGSILKYVDVVPKTYFSESTNILNVYFVKISWGWTLLLLGPFLFFFYKKDKYIIFQRLISLMVATIIWYACTETFNYIEEITGTCDESAPMEDFHEPYTTKVSCRKAGFLWHGFDISGHCFILAYSALIIKEEIAPMDVKKPHSILIDVLFISLNAIVMIWIWMFICTSVYFHDLLHKVFGTLCGILCWYLTYKVWYPKPFSPGLPRKIKKQSV